LNNRLNILKRPNTIAIFTAKFPGAKYQKKPGEAFIIAYPIV
jgi:hypothetical protein